MATVFKKTYVRAMPDGAKIVTRQGKQIAQWTDRRGKKRTAEVTTAQDGTSRIKTEAATYTAKYRDGEGVVREVATGCRDKQAAAAVLKDLTSRAELVKAKIMTPDQDRIADHQDTPLADHIAVYLDHLRSRGVHPDRIKTTATRMRESATACRWRRLSDMAVDDLETYLGTLTERAPDGESPVRSVSPSVFNGFVESWVSFGFWCVGKRMAGKRFHFNGEKRMLANPFEGIRRRDSKQDRRRVARALTDAELTRLLDAARRRPLEEALTIRTGPRKGELGANVGEARRRKLKRLGAERALIYKTAVLTGLRLNELRTMAVSDLSFGDVPFVKLRASNEKNRRGSTLAIRSDLAIELRAWIGDRDRSDRVFNVPSGLLRIMDRDLTAAGIPKRDEDGCVVHVHALRHSFGTHLSMAGVAPRVAQSAMRHSDIALTMNTYTDARLLDTAQAVESLPMLRSPAPAAENETPPTGTNNGKTLEKDTETAHRTDAPTDAPDAVQTGQIESISVHREDDSDTGPETKKRRKTQGYTAFSAIGATRFELAASTSRT